MDNINVVRVGFYVPEFKLSDTNGEIDDPVNKSDDKYTCLAFINPDKQSGKLIAELEKDLPATASGLQLVISVVAPVKIKQGKKLKEDAGFSSRFFCDNDLRVGRSFSLIDSISAQPLYHPVVFVVSNDRSVRYRQAFDAGGFDLQLFRSSVSELI